MTHQETRSKEQAIQANANSSRYYKKIQSFKHNVHNVTKIKSPRNIIYSPEKRQNESYPQEDLYSKFTLQIFHTKCRTVLNDEIENH